MGQADDRLRAVGADSLADADLIRAVGRDHADPLRGDLDRILCAFLSDDECLRLRDGGQINRVKCLSV